MQSHTKSGPAPKFTQGLLDHGRILTVLDIKPGQMVLDAGCGNGYMAEAFAAVVSNSGKVYALDSNAHYITALKDRITPTPANIEAVHSDITRMTPLKNASIDLIYIATVVHIFSKAQMDGFIREAKRLLKPGAILAVVEIEKKETPFGPPMQNRYAPEELIDIIPMKPEGNFQVGRYFYLQLFTDVADDL